SDSAPATARTGPARGAPKAAPGASRAAMRKGRTMANATTGHPAPRSFWRLRPCPLWAPGRLEPACQPQDAEIVEAAAGNLQADRLALTGIAAVDRSGRLLAHVVGHGEGDVLERPRHVVGRRLPLGT